MTTEQSGLDVLRHESSGTMSAVTQPDLMKALVYDGPGRKTLEDRPKTTASIPTDAIVPISA